MTLDQFIQKWLGKRTDYDKVYAYQCVDLILQYLADVHGIPSGVWGNAIDYWTKPTSRLLQDFNKVTGTPQAGDIVILNPTSTNPYGHIMIAVNGTTAIEQNGATGDGDGLGGDEIRYRTIPLNRVAGLLRKKGADDMPKVAIPPKLVREHYINYTGHDPGADSPALQNRFEDTVDDEFWYGLAGHINNVRKSQAEAIRMKDEQIAQLSTRPTKEQLEEQARVIGIKDNEIARLQALVSDHNLTVKQAIKVLYQTIIDAIKS